MLHKNNVETPRRPTIISSTTKWNKFKDIILNKTILNIKLKFTIDVNLEISILTDDIQKTVKKSSTLKPFIIQILSLSSVYLLSIKIIFLKLISGV